MMRWLLLILCLAFAFASFSSNEVKATIGSQQLKVGDQTTIDLEVFYSAENENIVFPALQDTITKFIEIVTIDDIDTTFDEEDVTKKILHQTLTITSWDTGYHVVPPFEFVVGGDTLKTNPLILNVSDVALDPEQDIKDIKDVQEVPFSLMDYLLARKKEIAIILGILLAIVLAYLFYKKYKNRPMKEETIIVPKEAADVVALRKLDELKAKELWQAGKVKSYYSELSFVVREYLENRYEVNALEQTTDETLLLLHSVINDQENIKKFGYILQLSDMAKFAKQQPIGSENEQALNFAYAFIESTKFIEQNQDSEINQKDSQNA